jgi:hypothetical protein
LDRPYPSQSLTALVWERDKGTVGSLSGNGQFRGISEVKWTDGLVRLRRAGKIVVGTEGEAATGRVEVAKA